MKQLYFGLMLVLPTIGASAQSLMDSLVAHYPLDGHTQDISGHNNHLDNSGATPIPGRDNAPNTAYRFGGTSFMSNTTEDDLRSPSFSWAFWMKIEQLPASGDFAAIISSGGSGGDNVVGIANNYMGYSGIITYGPNKHSGSSDTAWLAAADTLWHFYTVTRGFDSLRLFIDGEWVHSANTDDTAGYTGSDMGFYVGARQGNEDFFTGRLDDLWVWTTSLSKTQVDSLYDMVLTSFEAHDRYARRAVVYPNPSHGTITLETDFAISRTLLFNAYGQEIDDGKPEGDTSKVIFDLSPGTYILRIYDGSNQFVQKRVIIF